MTPPLASDPRMIESPIRTMIREDGSAPEAAGTACAAYPLRGQLVVANDAPNASV